MIQPKTVTDCSTVFSIVPFDIRTTKPGIYPGSFFIPACMDATAPSRLFIPQPSTHLMVIGGKKDPIPVPTPSHELARSIVEDFLAEQMWADEDAHPGITYFHGDVSVSEFISTHKQEYDRIKNAQRNWFLRVVEETDNDWNKYHHRRVVSDQAKFAVEFLKLEKDWMKDENLVMKYTDCPACGTKNTPNIVVCPTCRCVLDIEKHKRLVFA